jgi:hypothetical protein
MTDGELLELAAKAAGVECKKTPIGFYLSDEDRNWNPLTDDGDALRLAVRLDLIVSRGYTEVGKEAVVFYLNEIQHQMRCVVPHGNNPYAATRLAIVRAAAEMGRAK